MTETGMEPGGRQRKRIFLPILFAAAGLLAACEQLPRDPEGTLANVRRHSLRVGVIENPPWAEHDQNGFSGAEVELIEKLAEELNADVIWIRGGESALMPALERFALDAVIGGLTDTTPWSQSVGVTRPYFDNRFVIGTVSGEAPETLSGVTVAVPESLPTLQAFLRGKEAEAVPVAELAESGIPVVAAPAWQLESLGMQPAGIELHGEKHVIAVPPGENEWLVYLDRFLERETWNFEERLRMAEERN